MTQEPDKSLSETTIVEKAALELVKSDMNTAEKAPQPLPDIRKPAPVKADNRAVRERKARQASREMYADKTVPRIRSERRYGGSSHSRAYLKQALCLYSDRAQIFFENNYERVNMSLIVSTLVIEAIGGTKLAEEISLRLEKEFRELETQMIASIKELQRIATVKGIAEDQQVPAYDHKRFYEPPLHTPHSAQFMTVVQLFDRLISRAEGCWINHIMSAQTRKNIVRSCTRFVFRPSIRQGRRASDNAPPPSRPRSAANMPTNIWRKPTSPRPGRTTSPKIPMPKLRLRNRKLSAQRLRKPKKLRRRVKKSVQRSKSLPASKPRLKPALLSLNTKPQIEKPMTLIAKPTAKHRALRYLDTLDNKIHVEIHRRISYYLHDEVYLGHFGLRIDEQNRLTLLNAQDESSAHFAVRFRPNSAITLFSQLSQPESLIEQSVELIANLMLRMAASVLSNLERNGRLTPRSFVLQSKSSHPIHVQPSSHLDIFVHSESYWHQLPN